MKVVLTREPPRNDSLRDVLELAVDVVEIPATHTDYWDVTSVLAACPVAPATLVVTSSRATRAAAAIIHAWTPSVVIAVGATTAEALTAQGIADVLVSHEEGARGVAALHFNGPVVSVGAELTRPELGALVTERGLEFHHVAAYTTRERDLSDDERATVQSADCVVVAAPSAWNVLRPWVAPSTLVVVRGATTLAAVRDNHARVVVAPSETDTVAVILSSLLDS